MEEPLVRIPFKISCRESAEVWISAGKSFRLKQSMHSECKGSRKRSHTTLILCLCGPTTLSGSLCFAFSLPFMRFDSRHLRDFGWCPYYAARRLIHAASVVVLNYQHLGFKEFESLNLVHPTSSIQKQDLLFFPSFAHVAGSPRYVLDPKVSLASSLGGAPSLPGASRRQGSAIET